MLRITAGGIVKLCGLFYAVETKPGLVGSASWDYGDSFGMKTARLVDGMLARGFKPSRYLESKDYIVFTQSYLNTHDRYDRHMEIRVLAGLFRHFSAHLQFLTRIHTQHRINSLKARTGRFESSDSILRYKNMVFNMNVDDTNGPTTRFQLTPGLAMKHIFFYDSAAVIKFMRRLHSHSNDAFKDSLFEDRYRNWMLGDSVSSWVSFLSLRMQRFICEENEAFARKSNSAQSGSSRSYADRNAVSYDGKKLYDLIRLFRNLNEHLADIEKRHKGVTAHIGSSEDDLVTYFSLNIPAMFTIFWILATRYGVICIGEGLDQIQFSDSFDDKFPEWNLPQLY